MWSMVPVRSTEIHAPYVFMRVGKPLGMVSVSKTKKSCSAHFMAVKQSFSMIFVSSMRNNVQPVVMRVERQLEYTLVRLKLTFGICLYESWMPLQMFRFF